MTTLPGGETQSIKLACGLSNRDTGKILYLIDESTTGLHFHDNTIIVIEHNMDVIKTGNWIIHLDPEGGILGGVIV